MGGVDRGRTRDLDAAKSSLAVQKAAVSPSEPPRVRRQRLLPANNDLDKREITGTW
jgi:hypothetical protein